MRREKLLWKKWTQLMKASSFTKSPYTFVPLQARIWLACTCTLYSVMYILSSENITAVYSTTWRRWDQNTIQVANRLDRARTGSIRMIAPSYSMVESMPILPFNTMGSVNWVQITNCNSPYWPLYKYYGEITTPRICDMQTFLSLTPRFNDTGSRRLPTS